MSAKHIDNVQEQVIHYQKKLERYAADKRIESLLYCIHKLKYLPVTVAHLEGTGVGKTVNMLRNHEGITGSKARDLVAKWKDMVTAEEELETEFDESYNTEETEPTQKIISKDSPILNNDNDLQIEMPGGYDSNGNDLNIEDRTQNCYNPYTSQEDYISAGSSRQDIYDPTAGFGGVEYVPTQTNNYTPSQDSNTDCPMESLSIDEDIFNGDDCDNAHSEDSVSKKHKSKHKSKDKHKHKHHSKEKKKSKQNHHRDEKIDSNSHLSSESKDRLKTIQKTQSSNKKETPRKSDAKGSSSKRKVEPLNDFESALLGMDNYLPKPKKKKLTKDKKKVEPSTSKVSSSSLHNTSSMPRLPSFMSEGNDNSFNLSTSYKPIPHIVNKSYDSSAQRTNEEEGLNYMYMAKNTRTKIMYTGKSLGRSAVVPSLFNQCIRVLQDNIDALEYTGGIPYMILKPVLERATPVQLFNIENFNPNLLEDTGTLWESHSRRSFKNMKREEMETWRDMFIRCTDENDQKLKNVTEKLERKFVTRAAPKRTTQLAEFIGAPGKGFKKMAKSQMVSSNAKPNTSSVSSTISPPVSRQPPARPHAVKKPKMGVMMAKSVQLYKKIFRR